MDSFVQCCIENMALGISLLEAVQFLLVTQVKGRIFHKDIDIY